MRLRFTRLFCTLLLIPAVFARSRADDWPMWRFDAARSAASPENLPDELHLLWTREYGPRQQVWDDPLNNDLMPYDKVFEPVVAGGRMFVGFNHRDKLVALDVETGRELWTFYADGPVRLPPGAWQGGVYFTSDDGYLYCLEAESGKLRWRFRGGPSARKVLGNRRVISAWPARGGPVIRDGTVYFAASIWPMMGTFIDALDARTGKPVWVNDHTGADYILQPHKALSFAGVAPQGALAATEDILLVPGGRSMPAALDRATGEVLYFPLNAGGKGNGGSLVIAGREEFFVHTRRRGVRAFELDDGKKTNDVMNEPVVAGDVLYTAAVDTAGPVVAAIGPNKKRKWTVPADGRGDLIRAGNRLYAAGQQTLAAINIPGGEEEPTVAWSRPVEGEILRLLAADGKLFAVTLDGRILAFGEQATPQESIRENARPPDPAPEAAAKADAVLRQAGTREGYALVFGIDDGKLLEALAAGSQMHLVAVDPDREKIDRLRRRFDAAGLYGRRVALHRGDPLSFRAPPYIASLIVVGKEFASSVKDARTVRAIYQSLRPYGGTLWISGSGGDLQRLSALVAEARLAGAEIAAGGDHLAVARAGPLEGAGTWTHQYGNVANTVKSDDRRVRLPLGILWFGGNSNLDVLPRHGHGPPEQVVGGRLFIEGADSLSARDVYTGRVLWKSVFEDLGNSGVYFDGTYADTPLSTAYNQKHIPGANARGTNFVATAGEVYLVAGNGCRVLDAASGETVREITLPELGPGEEPPAWGYIGVYQDLLLAGAGRADFTRRFADPAKPPPSRSIEDDSASRGLIAFDRHTGDVLWKADARYAFLHNGIVAGGGRIYCLDRLPAGAEEKRVRRGRQKPSDYRLVAFDARSGRTLWETEEDVFGTWLSYSEKHDVLLQAGAKASDRLDDEVGRGMIAYRGRDGEVQWKNLELEYSGPCILHHETIITNADQHSDHDGPAARSRAFSLLDGSPRAVVNPLTGRSEPWQMARGKGCSTLVASEHLLLMRDGAAGYYDLRRPGGIGHFGGFKSGCTSNLLAADGVLNAPDYTRTCACAYQNQTSLALVPMPDVELWTASHFADAPAEGRIERVGINFGAPGDRRSTEGTLWLEYPVRPDAPKLGFDVTVAGDGLQYFCRHASTVEGPGPAWVAASGARNVESVTIQLAAAPPAKPAAAVAVPTAAHHRGPTAGPLGGAPDDSVTLHEAAAEAGPASDEPASDEPAPAGPAPAGPAPEVTPVPYTVRLCFAEPDGLEPGRRVFDVFLQGAKVLERFDVAQAAGGPSRCVVKEFSGVAVAGAFQLDLASADGLDAGPVLCGVELVGESVAD